MRWPFYMPLIGDRFLSYRKGWWRREGDAWRLREARQGRL